MKIGFCAVSITCLLGLLPAYHHSFTQANGKPFVVSGFMKESDGKIVYYTDKSFRREYTIAHNDVEARFDLARISIGSESYTYSLLRLSGPGNSAVNKLRDDKTLHRWITLHGEVSGVIRRRNVIDNNPRTTPDNKDTSVLVEKIELSEDAIDSEGFFVLAGVIVAENQMDALGPYFIFSMSPGQMCRIPYANLYDDDSVTPDIYEQGRFDVRRAKCSSISGGEYPFSLIRLRVIGNGADDDVVRLNDYVKDSPWTYCDSRSNDTSGVLRIPAYVSGSASNTSGISEEYKGGNKYDFAVAEGEVTCAMENPQPVSGCGGMCAEAFDDLIANAHLICAASGGVEDIDIYRCVF